MRSRPKGFIGVIKGTFTSYGEDKVSRLAAATTYYTIFSIAPLLVLVIAIAGFVIGNNANIRNQVIGQVTSLVGAQGAQMVNTLITNASKPRTGIIASVIGVIALIFGATGIYIQLKDALNTIWEVEPKKGQGIWGIVSQRIGGLLMILGLGLLLLILLALSTALTAFSQFFIGIFGSILPGNTTLFTNLINYGIQLIVYTFIFSAIFKGVPDAIIRFRDVWVGGLFTAILFLVGQFLISLYFSKASPASAYGAAGSLVILLLWIYYSAQILFLGAEFTKEYALWREGVITPTENARLLTPMDRIQQGIPRPGDTAAAREDVPEVQRPVRPAPPLTAPIPSTGDQENTVTPGPNEPGSSGSTGA